MIIERPPCRAGLNPQDAYVSTPGMKGVYLQFDYEGEIVSLWMEADAARQIAYLLNQGADKIDGKIVSAEPNRYFISDAA